MLTLDIFQSLSIGLNMLTVTLNSAGGPVPFCAVVPFSVVLLHTTVGHESD